MELFIKIAMLVLFFGVMIFVGVRCRRHAVNVNSFVLGGRSVGPWLTAFAYGTSYFSAVIFIGYAGQFGWKFGLASTWIGIGNAIIGSLLAWVILGRRTRLITQKLGSATMPDFFEKRFSSPALKIVSSLIVFVFLIPYTASLYNGLSRLFNMAFNIDYVWCIIIMSVLTGIYVILGGYMATAINDFIQGIVMLFGIVAVIVAVLNSNGGFMESIVKLSNIPAGDVNGGFASFFGPDPFNLLCVIILTSLGTWGLPQMIGKFYAIKDEKAVSTGTIISTVFALVVAGGCYFLGGFGRIANIEVVDGKPVGGFDAIIPAMLNNLPAILIGIVVILVLSASMSTLSSLVMTSSSTLTLDLIKGSIKKDMKEKTTMVIMKILIAVFIAISAVIAIFKDSLPNIAQLMGISWGALAGAFLAPYLFSLYWKRTTKASVFACFGFGVGVMLLNMFVPSIFPTWLQSPINCGAMTMLAGFIIVPIVSLITPKPNKEKVDEIFSCYDRAVTTTVKEHLE